jgi:uncharacterized protein (DUF1697 family)
MKHVAFLRGMNLGKRRVTNAQLQELFEGAGCTNVSTFQAAGNVLFDDGPSVAKLEAALHEGLGYDVAVYARTAKELAAIAEVKPFAGVGELAKPAGLHVGFYSAKVPKSVEKLSNDVDALKADGKELYWLARQGVAESTLDWKAITKLTGDPGTVRNANTVRKLAAKVTS